MDARGHRSADGIKPMLRPPFVLDSNSMQSRLPHYNGLRDTNLRTFFSSKRRRKLLVKVGLLSGQGEIREREPTPLWSRDVSFINMRKSREEEMFRSPLPPRNAYSSRRSQSVRVAKVSKTRAKKPITHEELQRIFDKYRPKPSTQQLTDPSTAPENTSLFPTEVSPLP